MHLPHDVNPSIHQIGINFMSCIKFTKSVSLLAAAGLLSISSLTLSAHAAEKGKTKAIEAETMTTQSSAELSAELGKKWGRVLTEGYGVSEAGLRMFVTGYANYPQEVLKSALNAKNFDAMNRSLMDHNQTLVNALAEKIRNQEEGPTNVEVHKVKNEMSKLLGDEARDLVYIPITPCRTFDTRTSVVGGFNGAVAPGTPKGAYVFWGGAPSFWVVNGGTVDSCPDTTLSGPLLANGSPYSVAMNVTVITPAGSGWITAYRGDLADPSATVVGKFVQNGVTDTALLIANVCRGVTGASCANDIKIASRGTTAHVAGDVVGYFIKPQATALDCNAVDGTSVTVAANAYANLSSAIPACAAGYTRVGVEFSAGADVLKADSGLNYLYVRSLAGVAQTVTPKAHCCRIPGR